MEPDERIARFGAARFAVLATHGPEGRIDLVPCCFALVAPSAPGAGPTVVSAVDHKPKRHQRLARLDNIGADDRVSMVVDERSDEWDRLWWVRLEGRASVVTAGPVRDEAIAALVAKYPQYQQQPPAGPAVVIEPTRWQGWSAT
ncbi:MAG: TIGR03668 family PPOX class F420-dependent oxidoreductase [Actinomycetota bacterium]